MRAVVVNIVVRSRIFGALELERRTLDFAYAYLAYRPSYISGAVADVYWLSKDYSHHLLALPH
jgi:hypothetical protein